MKFNKDIFVRFSIVLGIVLSLTGVITSEVQAVVCTWEGDNGPDWAVPGNWTCDHVPTTGDDISIPDVAVDPIINAATTGVDVNSISIASEGVLTVNATTNSLTIFTSSSFINNGEIVINGQNPGANGLSINSPAFANDGTVTINAGYLSLIRGGTHTGSFVGASDTVLTFSNQWPSQTWTFSAESNVSVPIVMVNGTGNNVNFNGEFSPSLVSPETSEMQISGSTTVNLNTNDILMPAEINVLGTLNITATSAVDIATLKIIGGALVNSNTLNITSSLDFLSVNLSGAGDIVISNTASSVVLRGGTISGKTLRNNATANWTTGNMTLSNSAVFENQGSFNANASTTMTGSAPASFTNHGTFTKNTGGTTTTMDIPFTNNGTVEVVDGSLVFQQGFENGDNVVLDLGGGTINPGDTFTIDSGDSLIGSGTLSADLVNSGTISPGSSPGTITLDGDFTQEASGTLSIELGGATPDTEYDQLVVTGAATLDGTLDVSLIDTFSPSAGQSFSILTYGSHTGTFSTLNLPDLDPGLAWEVAYGSSAVTLTVREGGGSIGGTVNYSSDTGYNPVTIGLFVNPGDPPVHTIEVTSTTGAYPYEITGIPNGTYYVSALMDLNDNNQPDPGEPYKWYGPPTAIVISDETPDHTGIDIQLGSTSYVYLPVIIH